MVPGVPRCRPDEHPASAGSRERARHVAPGMARAAGLHPPAVVLRIAEGVLHLLLGMPPASRHSEADLLAVVNIPKGLVHVAGEDGSTGCRHGGCRWIELGNLTVFSDRVQFHQTNRQSAPVFVVPPPDVVAADLSMAAAQPLNA